MEIGEGFKRLDAGGWEGEAGDAFRQRFEQEPLRWIKAGDAFHDSARALSDFVGVLEWAQAQACEAVEEYEAGQRATERAQDEFERGPQDAPFNDPGEVKRESARALLDRARQQLDQAGQDAASAVNSAQEDAPEKPSLLDEIGEFFGDAAETIGDIPGNIAHYALDGVGNFVDAAGTTIAGAVDGVGNVVGGGFDLVGLDDAARSVEASTEAASNTVLDKTNELADEVREDADDLASSLGAEDPPAYGENFPDASPQPVIVKSEKYPESAEHIEEAQAGVISHGPDPQRRGEPLPSDLTIDKENADINRRESLRGIPTRGGDYLDRDEYPPAMFREGGEGSSVKYIDASDNRGAGSSMNAQIRAQELGKDDHVRILVE
ncbi:NucA/NucB deoxyribonuclease domain-containing protein [Saccharopolyspora sp. ID03-671]